MIPSQKNPLFLSSGKRIAGLTHDGLAIAPLNVREKLLAELTVRAVSLHGHGVHRRLISFLNHSGNPHTLLLPDRLMSVNDSDIRLAAQDMVNDPVGIRGHIQTPLERLVEPKSPKHLVRLDSEPRSRPVSNRQPCAPRLIVSSDAGASTRDSGTTSTS